MRRTPPALALAALLTACATMPSGDGKANHSSHTLGPAQARIKVVHFSAPW